MHKIFLSTLAIIFYCSCSSSSQSTLNKIEALGLKSIDDEIITFYSEGHEKRARETLDLLKNSKDYFNSTFQVSRTFSIAILDSVSWIKITQIPYGLPFVSGPPYLVCIPATSDNILAKIISDGLAEYDLNNLYLMNRETFVNGFVSLIGFHELGHIYAKDFGMIFPNKWTYEFAATYFALCYLKDESPEMGQLWLDASEILVNELKPEYKSISDFEKLYVQVGVESYAWYQMEFLLRVSEVYDQTGKEFLEKLKNHVWSERSSNQYLNDMEKLFPGFEDWAINQGL